MERTASDRTASVGARSLWGLSFVTLIIMIIGYVFLFSVPAEVRAHPLTVNNKRIYHIHCSDDGFLFSTAEEDLTTTWHPYPGWSYGKRRERGADPATDDEIKKRMKKEIRDWGGRFASPTLVKQVAPPSIHTNCYGTECAGGKVRLFGIGGYMDDYEVFTGTPQTCMRLVYHKTSTFDPGNGSTEQGNAVHIGHIIEMDGATIMKTRSKWGEYATYEHAPDDVPPGYKPAGGGRTVIRPKP